MRLLRNVFGLAVLALAIPLMASAQSAVTFDHTGGGYNPAGGNVLVGPYSGTIDGSSFTVYCVDGAHLVRENPYAAYPTGISNPVVTAGDDTYSYYSPSQYAQAAWLTMQFGSTAQTEWNDIHQAIWNITSGGLPSGYSTGADNATYWETQATANAGSVNLTHWAVVHAVEGDAQEFLVNVPEPASMALLFTGLIGVAGVGYRRREDYEA